jgi:hypothetical protein
MQSERFVGLQVLLTLVTSKLNNCHRMCCRKNSIVLQIVSAYSSSQMSKSDSRPLPWHIGLLQ